MLRPHGIYVAADIVTSYAWPALMIVPWSCACCFSITGVEYCVTFDSSD